VQRRAVYIAKAGNELKAVIISPMLWVDVGWGRCIRSILVNVCQEVAQILGICYFCGMSSNRPIC
jgi:hypothetical protein